MAEVRTSEPEDVEFFEGSTISRPQSSKNTRATLRRSFVALFVLLIVLWGLVFFTGDRKPTPQLGIDLQGGTRVVLVPQGDSPSSEQLELARRILDNRINGMGVSGAKVVTDGNTLVITVPGEDSEAAKSLGQTSQLVFRPVIQPSPPTDQTMDVAYTVAQNWVEAGIISPEKATERLELTSQGIAQFTQKDAPKVKPITAKSPEEPTTLAGQQELTQKQHDVLIADRQSEDPQVQGAVGFLFECSADDPLAGSDDPSKPLITCDESGSPYLLGPAPLLPQQPEDGKRLTGDSIDTSEAIFGGYDNQSRQNIIQFKFKTGTNSAAQAWFDLTSANTGQQVAITLDSKVISAPVIQQAMAQGEATTITGEDITLSDAQDLANNLKYGALPLSFVGENGEKGGTTQIISPSLGAAALRAGLIAGLIGFVLIALWGLFSYREMGLVALMSLALSLLTIYPLLILLGRVIGYSLDLSGIAGLIIGLGTTADSFVIFFEKIKEDIRAGSKPRSAIPQAWQRAKRTIITGNMVAILASIVIYFLAVGEVKGFAFTLGVTTVVDIIIAFGFTAPVMVWLSGKPWFTKSSQNGLQGAIKDHQLNGSQVSAQEEAHV